MDLRDKIAVVTGGSSGIGKAIAVALSREGARVIFTYNVNESGADETLKAIGKQGKKYRLDLHNENEITELFDFIERDYGHLDILVNNAGINRPRDLYDSGVWREIFQVNLFSLVSCTGKAVKLM